ncbi:hypothetical protein FEM03_09775 [Phragmitibacter flavus]|uniref:Uncharacterized protein n=1 Tax=Phragmitibacter flavus TaxID=2576071 RepID=A0A5R8KFW2_9BACT|nr:hypothetical protein [Phragmitibacter flavus]TLD71183.1 hypothetical protein FEM03_09775 [Phragmitibacter flavus]
MNPKIKRFQQILLAACLLGILAGVIMVVLKEKHSFGDTGYFIVLYSGGLATLPLFYFASQVAFQSDDDDDDKK